MAVILELFDIGIVEPHAIADAGVQQLREVAREIDREVVRVIEAAFLGL